MTPDQEKELLNSLNRIAYSLEYLVRHAQQAVTKLGVLPIDPPPNPPSTNQS